MSILFYSRPDYMEKSTGPLNKTECAVYVERAKKSERAIPKGLSFEEVVGNKSLPPCSLPDFMDYLVYVEMNAENLQFYLWYQDYVQRWETDITKYDKALSPAWDHAAKEATDLNKDGKTEAGRPTIRAPGLKRRESEIKGESPHRTQHPSVDTYGMNFFNEGGANVMKPMRASIPEGASVMSFGSQQINSTNDQGQNWRAFAIQPNREEINQIILHYLSFDSPRELNISHKDRVATLHALQHTTHPSALLPALNVVEIALRGQSHPNFIRWSICNGNQPRVFFVRTMGVSHTIFGFLIAIFLTISGVSRWWRILALPMWFVGICTLIAAYKGLCVILHSTHMRNLRPWEDDASSLTASTTDIELGNSRTHLTPRMLQLTEKLKDGTIRHLSTFGSKNKRDSAEGEGWERLYNEKSLVKKIFDNTIWTEDETLRLLQDKIVLGAQIWAVVSSVILTVVFTALPEGKLY